MAFHFITIVFYLIFFEELGATHGSAQWLFLVLLGETETSCMQGKPLVL